MNMSAFGENFPYTNFHDLNLDWILKMIKELNIRFDEAISSKIKIANPIQWDITKPYEALTVVMYNDSAYLSTVPVPPGTLITDTGYWQKIFDMQAFENEIRAEVAYLDEVTLKTNSTKHLLYCGDSYSVGNSGLLYATFVSLSGIPVNQCHNLSVSGASFAQSDNTFLNQITNYSGNRNEITDIIVVGGINDALLSFDVENYPDITSLVNAMEYFITYANQQYPNAKVQIAYVGGCLTSSQYYTTLHPSKSQEMAQYAYTVVAQSQGYKVLKTYNAIHQYPGMYSQDGLHPSTTGDMELGAVIANTFNDRYAPIFRPSFGANWTFSDNITKTATLHYYLTILEDNVHINTDRFYIVCNQNSEIGLDFVEFMDLNDKEFRIRPPYSINCNVLLTGFTDTESYHEVPATIKFKDGKGYISLIEVDNNNYKTFVANTANSSTISFPPLDIVVKTADIN